MFFHRPKQKFTYHLIEVNESFSDQYWYSNRDNDSYNKEQQSQDRHDDSPDAHSHVKLRSKEFFVAFDEVKEDHDRPEQKT